MANGPQITDCEAIEVEGAPLGVVPYVDSEGFIVFWDGKRQYHTGATEDGPQLRKAMKHHFGR